MFYPPSRIDKTETNSSKNKKNKKITVASLTALAMLSSLGRRDKDGAMTRPVGVRKNTLVAGRKAICTLSAHLFTTWTLPRRADTRQ